MAGLRGSSQSPPSGIGRGQLRRLRIEVSRISGAKGPRRPPPPSPPWCRGLRSFGADRSAEPRELACGGDRDDRAALGASFHAGPQWCSRRCGLQWPSRAANPSASAPYCASAGVPYKQEIARSNPTPATLETPVKTPLFAALGSLDARLTRPLWAIRPSRAGFTGSAVGSRAQSRTGRRMMGRPDGRSATKKRPRSRTCWCRGAFEAVRRVERSRRGRDH